MASRKKPDPAKVQALRQQGTLHPHPESVTAALFQDREFFDARDLVQVKYEMLRQVEVNGDSISQAARAFGFSRPSFYQAQTAFERAGLPALLPRKRGPRSAHKLTAETIQFIKDARASQPALRLEEMATQIRERFGLSVHPRSIERALTRQEKKPR